MQHDIVLAEAGFAPSVAEFGLKLSGLVGGAEMISYYENSSLDVYGVEKRGANVLLPVKGVIGNAVDYSYYGGTSLTVLSRQLEEAVKCEEIKKIYLMIDSGGGCVTNVEQTAQLIRKISAIKPVEAIVLHAMSAAYWLASACDKIWVTGSTARVGSISVVQRITDRTKNNEMNGYRVVEVASGAMKTLGSPDRALSDADMSTLMKDVKNVHEIFTKSVANYRNISKEIFEKSADGSVFLAAEALDRNLIDGIFTQEEIFNMSDANKPAVSVPTMPAAAAANGVNMSELAATIAQMAEALAVNTKTMGVLEGRLAAFEQTEKDAQVVASAAKCIGAYMTAFARNPTESELSVFHRMGGAGQTAFVEALTSVKASGVPNAATLLGTQAAASSIQETPNLADQIFNLYKEGK